MVGGEGNEGKTFFIKKIGERYGSHRVCRIGLWVPTWYIFEDKVGDVDVAEDIFLFDIKKGICMERINYTLLENIVDGEANIVREGNVKICLLYTSPSPRDQRGSRMPSSA